MNLVEWAEAQLAEADTKADTTDGGPDKPPGLRKATGAARCGRCSHFGDNVCKLHGNYSVSAGNVCGDFAAVKEASTQRVLPSSRVQLEEVSVRGGVGAIRQAGAKWQWRNRAGRWIDMPGTEPVVSVGGFGLARAVEDQGDKVLVRGMVSSPGKRGGRERTFLAPKAQIDPYSGPTEGAGSLRDLPEPPTPEEVERVRGLAPGKATEIAGQRVAVEDREGGRRYVVGMPGPVREGGGTIAFGDPVEAVRNARGQAARKARGREMIPLGHGVPAGYRDVGGGYMEKADPGGLPDSSARGRSPMSSPARQAAAASMDAWDKLAAIPPGSDAQVTLRDRAGEPLATGTLSMLGDVQPDTRRPGFVQVLDSAGLPKRVAFTDIGSVNLPGEKDVLRRVESRGGKYYAEFYRDRFGYGYRMSGGGGSFGKADRDDALAQFEDRVVPMFQADANVSVQRVYDAPELSDEKADPGSGDRPFGGKRHALIQNIGGGRKALISTSDDPEKLRATRRSFPWPPDSTAIVDQDNFTPDEVAGAYDRKGNLLGDEKADPGIPGTRPFVVRYRANDGEMRNQVVWATSGDEAERTMGKFAPDTTNPVARQPHVIGDRAFAERAVKEQQAADVGRVARANGGTPEQVQHARTLFLQGQDRNAAIRTALGEKGDPGSDLASAYGVGQAYRGAPPEPPRQARSQEEMARIARGTVGQPYRGTAEKGDPGTDPDFEQRVNDIVRGNEKGVLGDEIASQLGMDQQEFKEKARALADQGKLVSVQVFGRVYPEHMGGGEVPPAGGQRWRRPTMNDAATQLALEKMMVRSGSQANRGSERLRNMAIIATDDNPREKADPGSMIAGGMRSPTPRAGAIDRPGPDEAPGGVSPDVTRADNARTRERYSVVGPLSGGKAEKADPGEFDPVASARTREGGMAWEYEDARGVKHVGFVENTVDRGGTDVSYYFRDLHTGELTVRGNLALTDDAHSLGMTVGDARRATAEKADPGVLPADVPSARRDRLANPQPPLASVAGERGVVYHEPEGFAPNMGFVVRNAEGRELYRGPQWQAHRQARTGIAYADQEKADPGRQDLISGGDLQRTARDLVLSHLSTDELQDIVANSRDVGRVAAARRILQQRM